MPEIIWKYYLAKGPEADDVLSRAKQAWDGIKAHRESLMEEYKANGVLPGDRKKHHHGTSLLRKARLRFYGVHRILPENR